MTMTLTERQKEEIINNNKTLAKNQFEMKKNELDRILRNYNVQRVDKLKKASLDSRNYDEEEEKEETSKK
jgi:hypothetical protein